MRWFRIDAIGPGQDLPSTCAGRDKGGKMSERTRIFVATPCFGGDLKMAYVLSALKLQAVATARGIDIQFHLIGNESLIVCARNELAHQFLVSGASHLLFIDADIGFEPEAVFRLLDCGADVSAAAYPLKHIDWEKVQRAADAKRKNLSSSSLDYVVTWEGDQITARGDGFAKVRYAGTGFLMMKRSALVRLCDAHPELKYRANHKSNDLNTGDLVRADLGRVSLFECMIDKTTGEYLSEDYAFCRRWLDLGGEIWLDLRSELTHFGSYAFRGRFADQLA
ncbi:hypothetical protein HU230_0019020 [Bradyrhizobium quebecense]|nr:hypothetical protein [Bradyrhizobium quebecense]UGA48004.1 hypothetical protein HU230_0019020 [Bradyrhizobium quebecense]